jgi:hypothetical protein
MSKEITPKEMLQMRLDGMTFQQIADVCGTSRQNVHQAVKLYSKKIINGVRGRGFPVEIIRFQGIYEHFYDNEKESITSFATKVYGHEQYGSKLRKFLIGESESHLTIPQIKRICEICGKPFEEVFKER